MDKDRIVSILRGKKLIESADPQFKPLTGGVSSDIYLLSDGGNRYVIKQARARLKVEDEWLADVSRNESEQDFILYVQGFLPQAVPNMVYRDPGQGFFVMEYLGSSFDNWKDRLLRGLFEPEVTTKAAELMAAVHLRSAGRDEVRQTFDTTANFKSLRIDPYLITTGDRHPGLRKQFYDEAERLEQHREALVHGDFSPKNMMVNGERLVLLDHEVAWYGDPAFDVAFLLNHLYLKMLLHKKRAARLPDLTRVFWDAYFGRMGDQKKKEMEQRTGRLLIMLMLARVDGKSPAEYLGEAEKEFVRARAYELLSEKTFKQPDINAHWKYKLTLLPLED